VRLPQSNSAYSWPQRGAGGSSTDGLLGPGPGGHPAPNAARPGTAEGTWPRLQALQRRGSSMPRFSLCRGPVLQTSWAKGFENDPGKTLDPNGFRYAVFLTHRGWQHVPQERRARGPSPSRPCQGSRLPRLYQTSISPLRVRTSMIVWPRKSSDSLLKRCLTRDLMSSSSSQTRTLMRSEELWHSLGRREGASPGMSRGEAFPASPQPLFP